MSLSPKDPRARTHSDRFLRGSLEHGLGSDIFLHAILYYWTVCKVASLYKYSPVCNIVVYTFLKLLISLSIGRPITFETPHEKTNKVAVCPAKTQISLGIRPVWSGSSLSAWRKLGPLASPWAPSEDSDQTGWMPRLIWVFTGRISTLLVLSRVGSFDICYQLTLVHVLKKVNSKVLLVINIVAGTLWASNIFHLRAIFSISSNIVHLVWELDIESS